MIGTDRRVWKLVYRGPQTWYLNVIDFRYESQTFGEKFIQSEIGIWPCHHYLVDSGRDLSDRCHLGESKLYHR